MGVVTRSKRRQRNELLQTDIIIDILSRLPVKLLLQFKLVSKPWRNLISSEVFVKAHLKRSQEAYSGHNAIVFSRHTFLHSFDFRNQGSKAIELHCPKLFKVSNWAKFTCTDLVGSSNGLLCFCVTSKFVLYNPATRCYKFLPKVKRKYSYAEHAEFAYDRISNDYKILKITEYTDWRPIGEDRWDVHVYSNQTKSWKSVTYTSKDLTLSKGVVVNNCVYLIDYGDRVIRSFDLNTESFTTLEFSLPEKVNRFSRLAFLKGAWHLLVDSCNLMIWKDDCWTTMFHCDHTQVPPFKLRSISQVLMFDYSEDGNKVLAGATQHNSGKFFWYDLKTKQTIDLDISNLPKSFRGRKNFAEPWVESLVPLEGWPPVKSKRKNLKQVCK